MAEPGIALDRFVADHPAEAAARLEALLAGDPHNAEGWRLLGRALRRLGRDDEAAEAEVESVRATAYEPEMIAIARAMTADDLPSAEALLRQRLRQYPFDVAAIRLMAELAARVGRPRDSETLLRRALELAPGFTAARANLASLLYRQNRFAEAVAELDRVLESGEANPASRNLMAVALGRIGDYDEALRLYEIFPTIQSCG
jgi:predicted Zn-dependent protease